jgi:hypothetical protein
VPPTGVKPLRKVSVAADCSSVVGLSIAVELVVALAVDATVVVDSELAPPESLSKKTV